VAGDARVDASDALGSPFPGELAHHPRSASLAQCPPSRALAATRLPAVWIRWVYAELLQAEVLDSGSAVSSLVDLARVRHMFNERGSQGPLARVMGCLDAGTLEQGRPSCAIVS
jgi:hypothetical protein